MENFKKIICFVLCAIMMMQFAGCSKNGSGVSGSEEYKDVWLTDKAVELEVFYPASNESDGQWQIFKEAAKMTNVSAKVTLSRSNTDFNQSFNLMVASGNMPDLVLTYDPVAFSKLGNEGAFVPLNKYIDKYAPNISKFLNDNPEIKERLTAFDGNIYYMPHIPGGKASAGWFIRKDWLDKLGLDIPENVDEFYNALTAFKNNDLNGNGKADEVPYFSNTDIQALFALWNARTAVYVDNDTVKYGPAEPEYRVALENIIKWYNEGLIDKEILTRATPGRDMFLTQNLGGATHDWFGSTAKYNDTMEDKVDGFNFVPFAPPTGVELESRPISSPYGWGISSTSENIEVAIKYMDFWFSQKGSDLMNFGVEGVHYDLVNGKPQFKPELVADPDFKKALSDFGVQMDIGFTQNFEYERQWINQIAIDGMKMYEDGGYIADAVPNISMWINEKDTAENASLQTQIKTYTDEKMQKWILGSEVLNDASYTKYLDELETMGLSRFLKLQQTAYDSKK